MHYVHFILLSISEGPTSIRFFLTICFKIGVCDNVSVFVFIAKLICLTEIAFNMIQKENT